MEQPEQTPSVTSDDGRFGDAHHDGIQPEETSAPAMVNLDAILGQINQSLAGAANASLIQNVYLDAQAPVEQMRVVLFQLGLTYYAFEMHHVREIVRHAMITHVPNVPDWLVGVFNFHGDITSVVDLVRFWGVSDVEPLNSETGSIIVAQIADQRIGLMVSGVRRIRSFPVEALIAQPVRVEPGIAHYVRGVFDTGDHLIRLVDSERLLLGPGMQLLGG